MPAPPTITTPPHPTPRLDWLIPGSQFYSPVCLGVWGVDHLGDETCLVSVGRRLEGRISLPLPCIPLPCLLYIGAGGRREEKAGRHGRPFSLHKTTDTTLPASLHTTPLPLLTACPHLPCTPTTTLPTCLPLHTTTTCTAPLPFPSLLISKRGKIGRQALYLFLWEEERKEEYAPQENTLAFLWLDHEKAGKSISELTVP